MGEVILLALLPAAGQHLRWCRGGVDSAFGQVAQPRATCRGGCGVRGRGGGDHAAGGCGGPGWLLAVAFLVGGGLYLAAQRLIATRAEGTGRMWMIYLAIATDLFSDGLLIGAGASLGGGLALVLAVGQVLADVPEGAASTMTFRDNDVPRSRRVLLLLATVIPVLLGAVVSFLLLRGRPERWQLTALVGTAGTFAVAAFEDMIAEAHETEDTEISTAALLVGFALFTVVSTSLG